MAASATLHARSRRSRKAQQSMCLLGLSSFDYTTLVGRASRIRLVASVTALASTVLFH
jgi:hypothetical protein